ncbi:TPA: hypothetical protein N0F65_007044 [Lagenidium giganteum]|uniref:Protein kinase domain-containing protein n=1 Tax=Lagenidium giganteum TaxID=4803 RepID=A0AAV2YWZ2_9STRA|nr:TPA: hypothetical protein N0F65_007044 [Lagenidium giganteum]
MTTAAGTGKWLAPEVISGRKDYDQASDIFAFGVVLSELDTHAVPYDDIRTDDDHRLADVAVLQRVAAGELLPTFLSSCPDAILSLARQCLVFEPQDRLTAVEVTYALRKYMASFSSNSM